MTFCDPNVCFLKPRTKSATSPRTREIHPFRKIQQGMRANTQNAEEFPQGNRRPGRKESLRAKSWNRETQIPNGYSTSQSPQRIIHPAGLRTPNLSHTPQRCELQQLAAISSCSIPYTLNAWKKKKHQISVGHPQRTLRIPREDWGTLGNIRED